MQYPDTYDVIVIGAGHAGTEAAAAAPLDRILGTELSLLALALAALLVPALLANGRPLPAVDTLVADQVAPIKVRGLNIVREIHIGSQKRKPQSAAQKAFWSFIDGERAAGKAEVESVEELLLPA